MKKYLGPDIPPSDIDQTDCILKKNKFTWTDVSVTESLTSIRMAELKDERDEYGFNKFWTSNGKIMVMEEGSIWPKAIYG